MNLNTIITQIEKNNNLMFQRDKRKEEVKNTFDENIKKISGLQMLEMFLKYVPDKAECSAVMETQQVYDNRFELTRNLLNAFFRFFDNTIVDINKETDINKVNIIINKIKKMTSKEIFFIIETIIKDKSKKIAYFYGMYLFGIIDELKYDVVNFFDKKYTVAEYWCHDLI